MITFRGCQGKPMHSHRLLYLHASHRDYQTVNPSKRVKTQYDDSSSKLSDIRQLSTVKRRDSGKTLNRSDTYSTNKIKYFDLDLKHLTSSTPSSHKNGKVSQSRVNVATPKLQCQNLPQDICSSLDLTTILHPKNKLSKDSILIQQGLSSQRKSLKGWQRSNMLDLFDKENIQELWQPTILTQNKRIKQLQNTKDVTVKYNTLKQGLKNKPKNMVKPKSNPEKLGPRKEERQKLVVKRVEKLLEDSRGNEYKVTIQRV